MLCCAVPSRRLAALSSRPIQQRYRPLRRRRRLAMHPTGSPLATSGIAQDPPSRSSADVDPVERPGYRLLPLRVAVPALVLAPGRVPPLVLVPVLHEVLGGPPEPGG